MNALVERTRPDIKFSNTYPLSNPAPGIVVLKVIVVVISYTNQKKKSHVLKVKTLCRIFTLTLRSAIHSTRIKFSVSAVVMFPEDIPN